MDYDYLASAPGGTVTCMPGIVDPKTGRALSEDDPDYLRVKVADLESQVQQLAAAVGNVQHRLSRLDREDLQWPGDSYEPTNTEPYDEA